MRLPFAQLASGFMFGAVLLTVGGPVFAFAESVIFSYTYPGQLYIPPPPSFQPVLNNPSISVQYHASAVDLSTGADACDSTVFAGTRVKFAVAPGTRQDIVWNGTGNGIGTPYGFFYSDAQYPFPNATLTPGDGRNVCSEDNWYAYECSESGCFNQYATFSVAPPTHTIQADTGFSCDAPSADGSVTCTAVAPGEQQVTFNIDATYGHFWWGYDDDGRHIGTPQYYYEELLNASNQTWTKTITAQQISCPISIIPDPNMGNGNNTNNGGSGPSTPSVNQGSCIVGTATTISMTSDDPNGLPLRYGIDWNADGFVDQWMPAAEYAPSGTSESASRTYAVAGQKTVKVMAENNQGEQSSWKTVSISCTLSSASCSNGLDIDAYPSCTCPAGEVVSGNICVVSSSCAGRQQLANGVCQCPSGQVLVNGACQLSNQCVPGYHCNGNSVYYRNASCSDSFIQACQFGCSNGVCLSPPQAQGSISAVPALVARGSTSQITWSASNVITGSCTVTGNGDTWSGASGQKRSSAIFGGVTYTLSCTDLDGNSFQKTVSISLLPVFHER